MNATKTIYRDPWGKRKTGYIIDGKTYQDEEGKVRVEAGSHVTTADGNTYVLGEDGEGELYDAANEAHAFKTTDFMDYLKEAEEAAREAERLETERAVAALEAERPYIHARYGDVEKSLYASYRQGQEKLDENLAAVRLDKTGFSESSYLKTLLNYQNELYLTEREKENALFELENAILTARREGAAKANAIAADYASRRAEAAREAAEFDREMDLKEQEFAWEKELEERETENRAAKAATDAALSMAELKAEAATVTGKAASSGGSSGSGGSKKGSGDAADAMEFALTAAKYGDYSYLKALGIDVDVEGEKKLTYSQALSAYKSGIYTEEVLSVLSDYLGYNVTPPKGSTTIDNYGLSAGAKKIFEDALEAVDGGNWNVRSGTRKSRFNNIFRVAYSRGEISKFEWNKMMNLLGYDKD